MNTILLYDVARDSQAEQLRDSARRRLAAHARSAGARRRPLALRRRRSVSHPMTSRVRPTGARA